ncbi:MAG: hypothetical protein ACHQT6_10305 [Candidatus Acidiferrales bacterium]
MATQSKVREKKAWFSVRMIRPTKQKTIELLWSDLGRGIQRQEARAVRYYEACPSFKKPVEDAPPQ